MEIIRKLIREELSAFLNEVKEDKNFLPDGTINNIFFLYYKGVIYFLNYSKNSFLEKTKNLVDKLNKQFPLNISPENINSFDSAINFFERGVQKPYFITGQFYTKEGEISVEIFHNQTFNPLVSGDLKKILDFLKGIKFIKIGNKEINRNDILLNKTSKKQIKMPKTIYHGTSSVYLDEILKKGIVPKPENTAFKIKHKKYIFLTTSFESAYFYARSAAAKYMNSNSLPIILEINGEKLNKNKVKFDYDFYKQFIGKGDEHYNKHFGINNNDLPLSNIGYNNMGAIFSKFGYDGIIFPNWIENVYKFKNIYNSKDYKKHKIN